MVASDLNPQGGEETVRIIEDCEGEAPSVLAYVSDSGKVLVLVETIISNYRRLDCAFNDAGITVMRRTALVDLT